ncbi:uncharacterized protein DUF4062 [Asanoa ferruginea]|uniref:Uncharacterized protein DUF4062 n=1 Tax=Asanoa ferruginea TaxID=53367 RepID=A0A3D9ZMZ1_9ACTN|nr:DUF4062 domain-containing protein [Asanoa ferruginea]REF98635.1 uncharacterized protein DUF4062 [Asanoa ferruginea]GIF50649.1 hypothetical protein Afe04nite_51880 [Asanoa ferruginea]
MARVFISSASGALAPYRQAAVDVCHRLGLVPVHMEEFPPDRLAPLEVCRGRVETADVFVLLLAHRYGSRPVGESRSYTELEYSWALERPAMAVLPFVVDSSFPWPPPDVDHGADGAALARFIERVKKAHTAKRLADLAAFREDLLLALRPYEPQRPGLTSGGIPAPPTLHAMPPYVGSAPFTGRSADLAALDEWSRSDDPVLVVEAIGGTGKSAMTWEWASTGSMDQAGRLWWSFYDGSASMTRFLQEVLAYVSRRPRGEVAKMPLADLGAEVLSALRSRPYLLVLDGFERLLGAYHRLDPSKVRDDEVESTKRSMIDPAAEEVLRELTAAGPSKILISTRLMPDALQGRFGAIMPGVRHLRLPGLTDRDTVSLLDRLGVRGSTAALNGFFHRLENHPLLIGIVAGLVRDYRPDPGGFERWLADPTAGAALALPELDLTQRRTHILAAALADLPPPSHRLLSWISVLAGAVEWSALEAINPFRPAPPAPAEPDLDAFGPPPLSFGPDRDPGPSAAAEIAVRQRREWLSSEPVVRAKAQLDLALRDLEERGLLWWDRAANSYDLHPIIRAYVHDRLDGSERVRANLAVRDHFAALPPEDPEQAASVEDLRQTITIFRALVGAGLLLQAAMHWARHLQDALLVDLGVYPAVIELLAPLARDESFATRSALTIAYAWQDRFPEAIDHEVGILSRLLEADDDFNMLSSLNRLAEVVGAGGSLLAESRLVALQADLLIAKGDDPDQVPDLLYDLALAHERRGELTAARGLIERAERLPDPTDNPWHRGLLHLVTLRLAMRDEVARRTLSTADFTRVADGMVTLQNRVRLAALRCRFEIQRDDFTAALISAEQHERLARNAGINTTAAVHAFLLARLGRIAEADAALAETLTRLPRLPFVRRPHYDLALALRERGRLHEAVAHAVDAYRQSWSEGPPYHHHWDLTEAHELLTQPGVAPPDLPVTDPATVKVPMEKEIRAYIVRTRERRAHS